MIKLSRREDFVCQIITGLPANPKGLHEIQEAQDADTECYHIQKYCLELWPFYMPNSPLLCPSWENKDYVAVVDGLALFDQPKVIPRGTRFEIIDLIQQWHLGITKCMSSPCMNVSVMARDQYSCNGSREQVFHMRNTKTGG